MRIASITLSLLIALLLSTSASAQGVFAEFLEPWPDQHASALGTPYAHPFFAEPAYLDRDLLISYSFAEGVDGEADEMALEFELEWALSKRLGLVIEAPVLSVDPDDAPAETGFSDLAFGGRALLIDRSRLLVSGFVEVEVPTGDEDRGLGAGEPLIFPSVLWWADLGNWTTLQGQIGPEMGLESGETEMIYLLALTRSWQGPVLLKNACRCTHRCGLCGRLLHRRERHNGHSGHENEGHDHDDHSHHVPGLITLYLEATGVTPLTEPDETTQFEIAPGISYGLTEAWDARAAVRVPLYKPQRFDHEFIFSAIRHF